MRSWTEFPLLNNYFSEGMCATFDVTLVARYVSAVLMVTAFFFFEEKKKKIKWNDFIALVLRLYFYFLRSSSTSGWIYTARAKILKLSKE